MNTPELDKMLAVKDEAATLSDFVDYLEEIGITLCRQEEGRGNWDEYVPITRSYEKLFADYFDIDLNKVEDERWALLDGVRKAMHPLPDPREDDQ